MAESAPSFECLWALEFEFQVCNTQLTNSAFIHYKPWEWGHLSTQASIGGFFFSTFKRSLSPSSCLQAAVLADTVQLLCAWHWKHHVVWLKMPSAVKDWGSVYLRGEKPSRRAHIGDKVCTSCGPWNLIAWGLSRLIKSVCYLPWTSCGRVMKGVINANEGQSAAVHKVTGWTSHLACKEDKAEVPAWFSGDTVAVSFHAI